MHFFVTNAQFSLAAISADTTYFRIALQDSTALQQNACVNLGEVEMSISPNQPSEGYRWQDRVPSARQFKFDLIVSALFAAAFIVLYTGDFPQGSISPASSAVATPLFQNGPCPPAVSTHLEGRSFEDFLT